MISDIEAYYKDKIKDDNEDFEIHGWESDEAQRERYDALINNVSLEEKSFLDVGCGTGALFRYIKAKNISCDYLGVDALVGMVNIAKSRSSDGVFLHLNIDDEVLPFCEECFDVIYSSGIFNLNYGNNELFIRGIIEKLFPITSETLVLNFLSDKSKNKEDKYFYTNTESIDFILKKSKIEFKSRRFIENYLDNDFTLILEK